MYAVVVKESAGIRERWNNRVREKLGLTRLECHAPK